MSEAQTRRPPDVLQRTAPPLSATSDSPLTPTQKPPESASGDPADGKPEITPQEQAAARAAKQDGSPSSSPVDGTAGQPGEETPPAEPDEIEVGGKKAATPWYVQREITKARNKQRESDAKASAAEAKMVELEKTLGELKAKLEPPVAVAPDPRPVREKFETPEAYEEELTAWATREGERKAAAKVEADRVEAERTAAEQVEASRRAEGEAELARLNTSWAEKKAKVVAQHSDYTEVAERDDLNITMPMAHAILLAENGPEIAYYLGKNPDEAARIAALAPVGRPITPQAVMASAVEIGRISAKLAAPAMRRPPPAPIVPLGGGNAPAGTDETEPTMDQWAAKREGEIRASRKPFVQGPGPGARH